MWCVQGIGESDIVEKGDYIAVLKIMLPGESYFDSEYVLLFGVKTGVRDFLDAVADKTRRLIEQNAWLTDYEVPEDLKVLYYECFDSQGEPTNVVGFRQSDR